MTAPLKTHCKHGHEYTAENTMMKIGKNGRPWRRCRTCSRQQNKLGWQRAGGNTLPETSILDELFSYDAETGLLSRRSDGSSAFRLSKKGYCLASVGYSSYPVHRLIWKMRVGSDVPEEIDHINGIKSDNRLSNLRAARTTLSNIRGHNG